MDDDGGQRTVESPRARRVTSGDTPNADETTDRLSVLIISEALVMTRPLPPAGEVKIGRAPGSDVVIDDPSISRTHAVLAIGPPLVLRDLGSANGTTVRDRRLPAGEDTAIAPGEVVQIGNATLIVQRQAAQIRAQRLWAHDYFEARLEEQCARSHRDGSRFGVGRLHCDPPPSGRTLQEVLAATARASDVVGEYSPNEVELLLVDMGPHEARAVLDRVARALGETGSKVEAGLACFPGDGLNAHELVHRASPFARTSEPMSDAAVSAAIVADRRMQDLYRLAERLAAGDIAILILGETGVGKEVMAERVHQMSPRASRPYVKLNCAALSETLLESELFGHERGAFTGAIQTKRGLLETAEGGTVFLDEIGELPHSTQVKLLRVIEERVVMRVGGLRSIPLDVRFIAATNRDLETEIVRGTFRQDLFFRLNGATLVIPPLRERRSEIVDLAVAFAAQAARQIAMPEPPAITPEAMALLVSYSWPGNIRELRNVIQRAVLLSDESPIRPAHLPIEKLRSTFTVETPPLGADVRRATLPPTPAVTTEVPVEPAADVAPRGDGHDAERERIVDALHRSAGNQTAAAQLLGIARRTLINRMELYGISGPRKRR